MHANLHVPTIRSHLVSGTYWLQYIIFYDLRHSNGLVSIHKYKAYAAIDQTIIT